MKNGFDLFLTMNGAVVIYADVPTKYFNSVNYFKRSQCLIARQGSPAWISTMPRRHLQKAQLWGVESLRMWEDHPS